jgi:hypothetical protein
MPGHIEQLDCFTNLFLGLAISIDFSGIKEVDTIIPCSLDAINCVLLGLLGVGVEPIAERNDRDLDTGGAKVTILHCHEFWVIDLDKINIMKGLDMV